MKPNVRRRDRALMLTPATTYTSHWRVTVRCARCLVPMPITVTQGRYEKMWEVDWAIIFQKVRFRCRCGTLADALKVERRTHDRPEEMLYVWVQSGYHCT